jgi:hypothetical protein
MLILMGGGNVIKCEISPYVKGDLEIKLREKGAQTNTFLFLRANDQRRSLISLFDISTKSGIAHVSRSVAHTRNSQWKWAVGALAIYNRF